MLLTRKLSSNASSLLKGLPAGNRPPELSLLPSMAFRTHGLPAPLTGLLPAPHILALPTPRPANGDPPMGLPDGLHSYDVLPSVAARLLLADREVDREYRGGVTYVLPGVSGAEDGPRPRRLRWDGVRGTSDKSSLRRYRGDSA